MLHIEPVEEGGDERASVVLVGLEEAVRHVAQRQRPRGHCRLLRLADTSTADESWCVTRDTSDYTLQLKGTPDPHRAFQLERGQNKGAVKLK